MFSSPAFAQSVSVPAAGAASAGGPSMILQFAPLLLIFLIFYLLILRPQQTKLKAHQAAIAAAKKGDTVVTGGGLIGKVTKVDDAEVEVEIATGVKVKVVKGTLSEVRPLASGKPAND